MGSSQSTPKHREILQMLQSIEKIIFDLNNNNIDETIKSLLKYFPKEFSYSYILTISRILYSYFISSQIEQEKFVEYLQIFESQLDPKVITIFTQLLLCLKSQESNYLLEVMCRNSMIDPKVIQNKSTSLYFAQYIPKETINDYVEIIRKKGFNDLNRYVNLEELDNIGFIKQFVDNYERLSKNDWELHKKYIEDGHNPNVIAKIIRNDEIEKLQEISSQTNFDFNQTIEPSLYEKCSFINKENVSLINYAAFFGSISCFRYLLMNNANINNTCKYAIAGGNGEIIHLCEQNHSSFEDAYETAIEFHRNDIFNYIYENKIAEIKNLEELGKKCIIYNNFDILSFLIKERMKINEAFIIDSIITGNLYIVQYFLGNNSLSLDLSKIPSFLGNEELMNFLINKGCIDLKRLFVYLIKCL